VIVFLIGAIAGRGALEVFFAVNNMVPGNTRVSYLSESGIRIFVESLFSQPDVILYSVFGPLWIMTPVLWWDGSNPVHRRGLTRACLFIAVPTVLTLDRTRVFSHCALPVLLAHILSSRQSLSMHMNRIVGLAAVSLVVPTLIAWIDRVYTTSLFRCAYVLWHAYRTGFQTGFELQLFRGGW
jgi:hypothetical protein